MISPALAGLKEAAHLRGKDSHDPQSCRPAAPVCGQQRGDQCLSPDEERPLHSDVFGGDQREERRPRENGGRGSAKLLDPAADSICLQPTRRSRYVLGVQFVKGLLRRHKPHECLAASGRRRKATALVRCLECLQIGGEFLDHVEPTAGRNVQPTCGGGQIAPFRRHGSVQTA